jgi:hypothetical protein
MAKYIVHNGIHIASEFTPETFDRLTTIGPKFKIGKHRYQVCQCSCSTQGYVIRRTDVLKAGQNQSCGCLCKELLIERNTTHGQSYRSEMGIWRGMISRCHNPKNKSFKRYGGRGIRVCDRWNDPVHGYANFLADMGPRPGPEYSIDRYPIKNGNYELGNCRWATMTEQNRNRKDNRMLTAFGRTQCMAAWAEEFGVTSGLIYRRLKEGWGLSDAISKPPRRNPCK